MLFWLILIILFIMVVGTMPHYPYSRRWGYYPSGAVALFLVLLLCLWFFALIPWWGAHPYWWGD